MADPNVICSVADTTRHNARYIHVVIVSLSSGPTWLRAGYQDDFLPADRARAQSISSS